MDGAGELGGAGAAGGPAAASCRCACWATTSAPRREGTKAIVWAPDRTERASRVAVSSSAEPSGCHSTSSTGPRDDRSTSTEVTSAGSAPIRVAVVVAGSAAVAEATTNVGSAPYQAARRRSRRSTSATWDPKTPR